MEEREFVDRPVLRRQHHVIEALELLGDGVERLLEPPRVWSARRQHERLTQPSELEGQHVSRRLAAMLGQTVVGGRSGTAAPVVTTLARMTGRDSPFCHVRMLSADDGLHVQAVAAPAGQAAPVVPQHAALRQSGRLPNAETNLICKSSRCMTG